LLYSDQLNPIAELDSVGNVISHFIYATRPNIPAYMIKQGIIYRIVSDQLGSVRLVINVNNGSIVQRIDYDEFGRALQNTNPDFQPFGYAGGIYDKDTKLVRFGARDYDSELGRWILKDPIRFEAKSSNLFSYTFSDPVNFIDANGEKTVGVGYGIGGSLAGFGFSFDKQIVADNSGNIGIAITTCIGGSTQAIGLAAGIIRSKGNAPNIFDLRGINITSEIAANLPLPVLFSPAYGEGISLATAPNGKTISTVNNFVGVSGSLLPVEFNSLLCSTKVCGKLITERSNNR